MITKEIMAYRADEVFALTEIIEVAYETALKACNEGKYHETALERVKNILFIASNSSGEIAHALSDLISECAPVKEVKK